MQSSLQVNLFNFFFVPESPVLLHSMQVLSVFQWLAICNMYIAPVMQVHLSQPFLLEFVKIGN